MKLKNLKNILPLLILCTFFSCKKNIKESEKIDKAQTKSTLKYATGFNIEYYNDFTKLIIKMPYQNANETFEFILVDSTQQKIANSIQIPIKSVVVTSTTHVPMLEFLNVENKLIGYPNTNYITSKKTRSLINTGKIVDLGNEENINTELLLELNPDLIIGFSINSNNKMFTSIEKMGIPVILNGDWLEQTPLGRAEWIKLFGVLFGKEQQANAIFNEIEKNYIEAKTIASKSTNQPTIISGGLFKDIWNLPAGDSFEATFLKDANTNYLWKNSKGKGSLSLNIENVFEKGKDADIWIAPGNYNSLEQLKNTNNIYTKFKAFKNKNVFAFSKEQNDELEGILYYELAPARPDLVLKDLIKIAHPKLLTNYELTFYKQLK